MGRFNLVKTKAVATRRMVRSVAYSLIEGASEGNGMLTNAAFEEIYAMAILCFNGSTYNPTTLGVVRDAFLSYQKPIEGYFGGEEWETEYTEVLHEAIKVWNDLVGKIEGQDFTVSSDDFRPVEDMS